MKYLKNDGFTLVELLAVIVILGILMTVAVPAVLNFANNSRSKVYCSKIETIEKAARLYGQDNIDKISQTSRECLYQEELKGGSYSDPKYISKCSIVSIKNLVRKMYLKKEDSPVKDSDGNIVKENGETVFKKNDFLDPRDYSSMLDDSVYVYVVNKRAYASFIYNNSFDREMCGGDFLRDEENENVYIDVKGNNVSLKYYSVDFEYVGEGIIIKRSKEDADSDSINSINIGLGEVKKVYIKPRGSYVLTSVECPSNGYECSFSKNDSSEYYEVIIKNKNYRDNGICEIQWKEG